MKRNIYFILVALGIFITGSVEELQAIVGRPITPVSVAGTTRRVARRTARRTTARVAAVTTPVVATTTVVTAAPAAPTGIPIGTAFAALPNGCTSLTVNGLTYYQCSGVYYQPQYSGPNLVYVVVAPPS
jgi:hypothetical protein